jgi:hypothetical protein
MRGGCRTGGQAQNDRAAGLGDGLRDLANLTDLVGVVRDAIDLDEINPPRRI